MRSCARDLTLGVTALAALVAGLTLPVSGAKPAKPPKVLVLGTPEPLPADAVPPPSGREDTESAGVPVAQASLVEAVVDVRAPQGEWTRLAEGARVHTGDRLRTDAHSVARIDFPWMSVSLGPSSELAIVKGRLLGLHLESGRIELASERDDIVKLDTPEARVRGRGRLVVRRDARTTRVSQWHGEARVRSGPASVTLKEGFGCVVEARRPCRPVPLPAAPVALRPGSDPTYVAAGEAIRLAWSAPETAFHVQVLSFDQDAVLAQRDVNTPSLEIALPWPGLYRFRASARDQGLEGRPSLEGLFQVMPGQWLKSGTPASVPPGSRAPAPPGKP